jgi:hypothetical protein
MQFQSKNIPTTAININYNNRTLSNNTNFKAFWIANRQDNALEKSYWNDYSQTESSLFYDQNNKINIITKMIYHVYFHSIITQGLVLGKFLTKCQHIFCLPWRNSPRGTRPPQCRGFMITLRHTILFRTPLDEWPARRWDLFLTTHITHKRQTSMPPVAFESTIPASKRPRPMP